jgi:hypothetical protein
MSATLSTLRQGVLRPCDGQDWIEEEEVVGEWDYQLDIAPRLRRYTYLNPRRLGS